MTARENDETDINAAANAHTFDDEPISKGSIRTYNRHWRRFIAWCDKHGLCALPAAPKPSPNISTSLRAPYAPAYIDNILAVIGAAHTLNDLPSPNKSKAVAKAMRAVYEEKGRRQKQAVPINRALLNAMVAKLNATIAAKRAAGENPLRELRDRAMLCVGYDTMARCAELIALRVGDIKKATGKPGSTMLMRRNKADQRGEGRICYLFARTTAYAREWIDGAGIGIGEDDGPNFLFRSLATARKEPWCHNPNVKIGADLSAKAVYAMVKERDTRSRAEQKAEGEVSGHSLRVGHAQDMAAFNISPSLIQQAGGWKSEEEMAKYIAHIKAERVGGAQIAAMDAEDEDAPAAVVALTITGDASPATVQLILAALAPLAKVASLSYGQPAA